MKKLKLTKAVLICIISATAVIFGCNKLNDKLPANNSDADYQTLIEKSKSIQEHVEAFKTKMEYYRDNPGIKSGGSIYDAENGAMELESLLNYNFCYTDVECWNITYDESQVVMPLDDLQKINDPKLMEVYYDKVIDTIQEQMDRINLTDMKLLLVDLAVSEYDSNGDAVIKIGILAGRGTIPPAPSTVGGWWYGNNQGTCDHLFGLSEMDATDIIANDVEAVKLLAPPPGKILRKKKIMSVNKTPSDYWVKPPESRNNYLDSKIFNADIAYGTIDEAEKCISNCTEMYFYTSNLIEIVTVEEIANNLEYTGCNIDDISEYNGSGDPTRIYHNYKIFLGEVWLIDDTSIIEDIQTY